MEDNLQNTKTQTTVEMKKTDKIQNMNKKQNTDKKLKKLKRNQIQNTDNDNTDIDVSESRIGSFRINRTGIELIIGNVIYYILGQILILIFADRKLNVSVGFILGVVISVLMTVHMTIAIEQAMSFNERGADRHVKKTTAVRMILCFIALIAIGITHVGDIVAALFGVMALAPELIRVFATSEYYEAVWIVPPVAASVFFMFFYNVFTTFEFYYEKTVFVMIASVLGAVLNIILNYYGIKKFGYLAAGYTTLICYILFGVAHYIFSMHVLKVKTGNNQVFSTFWLVVLSAVVLLGMFCMTLTYQFTGLRYSILALMIVVFVACREKIIDLIKIMKEK